MRKIKEDRSEMTLIQIRIKDKLFLDKLKHKTNKVGLWAVMQSIIENYGKLILEEAR